MFNLFKAMFVINALKRNKKHVITIGVYVVILCVMPYIVNDLAVFIDPPYRLYWILTKWLLIVALLVAIAKRMSLIRINPVKVNDNAEKQKPPVNQYAKCLTKNKLLSKGERIKHKLKKY
jgi:hypothetical protein